MTTPASHLDFHLQRELDRRWASAGVRHVLRVVTFSVPFIALRLPLGVALVLVLAVIAWFAERRRLRHEGPALAIFDVGARSPDPDLMISGAWVMSHDTSSRLAPLVLHGADAVAGGLALPKRVEIAAKDLLALLLSAAMSLVIAFNVEGRGIAPLREWVQALAASPKEPSREERPVEETKSASESREVARDPLIQLTMKSDRRIYKLECPIELKITLESREQLTAEVPIEVRLALSDGLPYPDAGFGDGFRVVSLPLGWTVPATPGRREQRVPILDLMKRLEIYRPGLFTLQIAASPFDLMGNQVVIQVTENIDEESIKIRQPVEASEQPEKREESNKPPKKGDTDGPRMLPKLGDPDRLPDVKRVAKPIEPLFNDGPTIEKEVSIWDREKGGNAPPPPPPPPIPTPVAPREFTRQPESGIPKPHLAPADREAMRRYFRRVDG